MKFRLTDKHDIPEIMDIYQMARDFQRNKLGLFQWADNYPSIEQLETDILSGGAYVVEAEIGEFEDINEGTILGSFYLQQGPDELYLPLRTGWPPYNQIVTLHRVATRTDVKGIGNNIFQWIQAHYSYVMIDTHADNNVMRHLIEKYHFDFLGVITIHDGTLRNTYQWVK